MADGTTRPIGEDRVGDEVMATDPTAFAFTRVLAPRRPGVSIGYSIAWACAGW